MKLREISTLIVVMIVVASCQFTGVGETPEKGPVLTEEDSAPVLPTSEIALPTLTPVPVSTKTPTSTPEIIESPTQPLPELTFPPGEPIPTLIAGEALTITQISMVDQFTGWGVAKQLRGVEHVVRTQDGGYTWQNVSPPQMLYESGDNSWRVTAKFIDLKRAWVLYTSQSPIFQAYYRVWVTEDGGETWVESEPIPSTGDGAYFSPGNFSYVAPGFGWLIVHVEGGMHSDYSEIFATADGGYTWVRVADPYSPTTDSLMSLPILEIEFADEVWGMATKSTEGVMPQAFVVQTFDGGYTWKDYFLPAPAGIDWEKDLLNCSTLSPAFVGEGQVYLLLNCRDFDGNRYVHFYASQDYGETWQITPLNADVHQLIFWDADTGYALGRNVLRTFDGGNTWEFVKEMKWQGDFSFVDAQYGWAVAEDNGRIALVRTEDGGASWDLIKPVAGK